jgi:aminopeptidase N/puromycin-sensitive aminopeptidase
MTKGRPHLQEIRLCLATIGQGKIDVHHSYGEDGNVSHRLCRGAASFVLSFFCFLAILAKPSPAQRLPTNVAPENYKLFLDPDIDGRRFTGEETIRLQVSQPVREIVLNSLDLDIALAEVTSAERTLAVQIGYDKPSEMVRLSLPETVPAGSATLHLKFSAPLTDGLRGLYLSKTPRRAYAVTQFEGTYARMMFPSFDEPAFKATFDLSVTVAKDDTAISNGRIIADEPVPGSSRRRLTFSTSPRMSTYLVALAIGDWQCQEGRAGSVPIRVCAVPEKKAMTRFALEAAEHSIDFYNRWYGIPYPFGKLDMLAIPDYEWGGMENTASIFYRESALLLDDKTASVFSRRGHATTIAHEIAHQWFGDLVTAAWWDDIWLNEGFATWMEHKPIEAWHPEWRLEEDEAASTQQILNVDSLSTARAIHGDPHTSGEIKEMFDGITYQKGGAVLGMLESYVGPEVFRRGVNKYLQEHANGNATAADFWRAETEVSGKPIDQIMPPFVMQPGAPVISVSDACHADFMAIQVAQQRFRISPEVPDSSSQQWLIPVCMRTADDSGPVCELITEKTQAITMQRCPAWFFPNRDAKGYYRIFYEDPRRQALIAKAAAKELTPSERIALIEDAWAMTRAAKMPASRFLELAVGMREERDRNVLSLVAAHLGAIGDSLVVKEQEAKYRAFLLAQFQPLARELGWNTRQGDSDEQKALRASLLGILGGAGDPEAIAAAQSIVRRYMQSPGSAEGTITDPAFFVAAANGDQAFYDQMSAAVAKPRSVDEYNHALGSLAQFRQTALLRRTLELVDQNKIRQQDYPNLFSALLANPSSRDDAWNYLKAHWEALSEKVTSFGGRGAVSGLGSGSFCSAPAREDVRQFFAGHRAPGAEGALKQSLERMDNCIVFKRLQQPSVRQWLDEQK